MKSGTVAQDAGPCAWPLLGLIAAALTGVIALETALEVGLALDDQSHMSAPAVQTVAVAAAAPHEDDHSPHLVETLLARPLFDQTRRPPVASPSLAQVAPRLPQLSGVVVSSAGAFAIFANNDGGKPIVVRKGDQVGAAVIEIVTAGQVTLRGPEGILVLHPSFGERVMQASGPNPASLIRPGYRPRQGGHDAAILNRKVVPAT